MSTQTEKKQVQAHGMTAEELNQLQYRQMSGEVMATSQNNDDSQAIPEHERHLVHVELEQTNFDSRTGRRLSTPFKQTYTPAEFKQAQDSGALAGYDVKIISHPSNFNVSNTEPKRSTGPLLGQAADSQGVEGSAATTAGETLLQTTGSLESKTIEQNAGNTAIPQPDSTSDQTSPDTANNNSGEGLTAKQKLQNTYREVTGNEAPESMTMVQLQQGIDEARNR